MRAIIVIPTIREKCIKEWLKAWRDEFKNHQIFIVEDNIKRTFKIKQDNVTHFCHQDIEKDLKKDAWIINRKDPSVGSYGVYKAYQENPDMILFMNDDCLPRSTNLYFLEEHWDKLKLKVSNEWLNPLFDIYPRGYPYKNRNKEVVLNMGLWQGIPDVDAITQLSGYGYYQTPDLVIPKGSYFSLCDMNISFKPKIAPYIYKFAINRYDDIWMGIRLKRYCDGNNYAITLGNPQIIHSRASNPYVNLQKESIHLEENETFYKKPIPNRYKEQIDIWMNLFK